MSEVQPEPVAVAEEVAPVAAEATADAPAATEAEDEEFADAQVGAIIRNLSSDEIDMLRDAFIHMDRDSDGFVGLEEMMLIVMQCVGEERYGPLREYLEPIFHVADKDRDGKLSLTEFLSSFADGPGVVPADVINQCVASIRVRLTDEEIAALQESFRRIDRNEDGYIDRDELTGALKEILLAKFPDLTDHTFGEIVTVVLASADRDRDGKLSLSEFIRSFQEDQGVLPAAFIDVRAQHVARQLSAEEIRVLKEAFAALDKNHDGFVDFVEMYQALWEALESSIQDKNQVRELCDLIMVTADRNQKGMLTLTDFIRNFVQNLDLMKIPVAAAQERIRKSREKLQSMFDSGILERLVEVFADLDKNGDGFLDRQELNTVLGNILTSTFPDWDEETTRAVIDAIISAADIDRDGRLSLEEFIRSFVDGAGVLPEAVVEQWVPQNAPQSDDADGAQAEAPEATTLTPQEYAIVRATFETMDKNADGVIDREELKAALLSALSDAVTSDEQLQHVTDYVMAAVDKNQDGELSWAEFKRSFELGQQVLPVAVPVDEESDDQPPRDPAEPSACPDDIPRPKSPVAEQLDVASPTAEVAPVAQQQSTPARQAIGSSNTAEESYAVAERNGDVSPIRNDVSGVAISEAQLRREFSKYDRNNNGFLDRTEFKKAYLGLEHYGLIPTQSEIDRLFSKYGKNDRVNFDEFCVLMLTRSRM